MDHSKLSEHKFKKGKFITPFSEFMTELDKENSWYYGRLPEYIWLALILDYYGREKGLAKCYVIIKKLHQLAPHFITPRLSKILDLKNEVQQEFYKFIIATISPNVMVPLTTIFTYSKYPCFSSYFCNSNYLIEKRRKKILTVLEKAYGHQTNFSTDIRFVVLYFELLSGRLHMSKDMLDLILEYPHLSHDDEKMKMIRPTIRASEQMQTVMEPYNENYLNLFWEEVSRMSDCELYYVDVDYDIPDTWEYITHIKEVLSYYSELLAIARPLDSKMLVLLALATYCE
jgi:hypothetical protein